MKEILAALVLLALSAPSWGAPCCSVGSVDRKSGIVTAQEKSSGRSFEIKVDNAIALHKVQPGQAVDADFGSLKAGIEGLPGRYSIVKPPAAVSAPPQRPQPSVAASPPAAQPPAKPAAPPNPQPAAAAPPPPSKPAAPPAQAAAPTSPPSIAQQTPPPKAAPAPAAPTPPPSIAQQTPPPKAAPAPAAPTPPPSLAQQTPPPKAAAAPAAPTPPPSIAQQTPPPKAAAAPAAPTPPPSLAQQAPPRQTAPASSAQIPGASQPSAPAAPSATPSRGLPPSVSAPGVLAQAPQANTPALQPRGAPPNLETNARVPGSGARPDEACCTVTAVERRGGVVTAKQNASNREFEFRVDNPIIAQRVQVGQAVRADFEAGKASVEGLSGRFTIVSAAAPTQSATASAPRPTGGPTAAAPAPALAKAPVRSRTYALPAVTAGPIEYVSQRDRGRQGMRVRPGISQLRDADEIEQSDLPEAAKTMLLMHTLQLPRNSSDHYIVNKELAVEWAKAKGKHVKDEWRPKKKKPKKKKCDWQHLGNCVDKVVASAQDLWEAGSEDWKRAWRANTKNLAESLEEAQECFTDHTIPLGDVPLKFNVTPQFPISIEKKSSGKNASGTVQGSLTVGLPVEADFRAAVELFYIPCLPFAIRPKSVGADGTMTIAAKLDARVLASGEFSEKYMVPPSGGPAIPIAVIPIVVAGVPVAILDVSLYIDGSVRVGGEGNLDGRFQLLAPYTSRYDFRCSGNGCSGRMKNVPVPTTATENVLVKGSVYVQPAIYTALQLSLNFEALAGRAGPQPFLYGEVRGCSSTSAMQNTSGQSSAQEFHALSADLDWGIEFRAEALVAGEQVTEYVTEVMKRKHLWFGDIAPGGSTAMSPHVGGPLQLAAGQPGQFQLGSRPCYPYKEPIDYSVTWTGAATTSQSAAARPVSMQRPQRSANSGDCTWGQGQGSCKLRPGEEANVSFAWPQPGSYTVTMTPLRDSHDREFKPERATRFNVTVQ